MSKSNSNKKIVNKSNQPQQSSLSMKRKQVKGNLTPRTIDYHIQMSKCIDGELTDQEIFDLKEEIKSWDLYRISYLQENPIRVVDYDGIPNPILKHLLSHFGTVGLDWEEIGIKYFTVQTFDEEEDSKPTKPEFCNGCKTVGEYYRTLEYQLLMYQVHYR
ncbi:hypothetical protein [Maribacter sp. Asnod1-A12]|uniref:hypothetical protein n=1 Tax=Maribacter sp. Asnod1-A12 TaxID=3160576 RepID=UPI00386C42F0